MPARSTAAAEELDPTPSPPPASVRREVVRRYNFWVLVYRAPDVPGQWIAQCLDVGVVTHGYSLDQAIEMAREAVTIVVEADLAARLDPLERPAADEDWATLWQVVHAGHIAGGGESVVRAIDTNTIERCAAMLGFCFPARAAPDLKALELPVLWTTPRAA